MSNWDNLNFAPQGWQCPICKRVYSPITPMCYYCGNGVQTTNWEENLDKSTEGSLENTNYSFDSQSEKEDDSCEETERSNPLGDYCANFTRAIVRHRTILERFFREQFSSSGRSKASDSDSKSVEWTGSSDKEVNN